MHPDFVMTTIVSCRMYSLGEIRLQPLFLLKILCYSPLTQTHFIIFLTRADNMWHTFSGYMRLQKKQSP